MLLPMCEITSSYWHRVTSRMGMIRHSSENQRFILDDLGLCSTRHWNVCYKNNFWMYVTIHLFARSLLWHHFLPEASFGLRVLSLPASVCVCVCVCGNHLLVRAITCHPFKLESPNLAQKSKTPWLRSLLFWGVIDLELQGRIKLQSEKSPYFELVHAIIHHPR